MYYKCISTEFGSGRTLTEIEVRLSSMNLGSGAHSLVRRRNMVSSFETGGEVTFLLWCASSVWISAVAATFSFSAFSPPILRRALIFLNTCIVACIVDGLCLCPPLPPPPTPPAGTANRALPAALHRRGSRFPTRPVAGHGPRGNSRRQFRCACQPTFNPSLLSMNLSSLPVPFLRLSSQAH